MDVWVTAPSALWKGEHFETSPAKTTHDAAFRCGNRSVARDADAWEEQVREPANNRASRVDHSGVAKMS